MTDKSVRETILGYQFMPNSKVKFVISEQFAEVIAAGLESRSFELALKVFAKPFHSIEKQTEACVRLRKELLKLADQVVISNQERKYE